MLGASNRISVDPNCFGPAGNRFRFQLPAARPCVGSTNPDPKAPRWLPHLANSLRGFPLFSLSFPLSPWCPPLGRLPGPWLLAGGRGASATSTCNLPRAHQISLVSPPPTRSLHHVGVSGCGRREDCSRRRPRTWTRSVFLAMDRFQQGSEQTLGTRDRQIYPLEPSTDFGDARGERLDHVSAPRVGGFGLLLPAFCLCFCLPVGRPVLLPPCL